MSDSNDMEDWNTADADWGVVTESITDMASDSTPQEEGEKVSRHREAGTNVGANGKRRTVEVYELSEKYLYRRAFGESRLLSKLGIEPFQIGHSYHCITAGDVDSLSYIKVMLLHQQCLEHLFFSTWNISGEDIKQLEEWVEEGRIKHLDSYVGEILTTTYAVEWRMLNQMYERYPQLGRLKCFRTHSKVLGGYGEKFPFVVETSANLCTNGRTEQATITIDQGLYDFYHNYFDNIT